MRHVRQVSLDDVPGLPAEGRHGPTLEFMPGAKRGLNETTTYENEHSFIFHEKSLIDPYQVSIRSPPLPPVEPVWPRRGSGCAVGWRRGWMLVFLLISDFSQPFQHLLPRPPSSSSSQGSHIILLLLVILVDFPGEEKEGGANGRKSLQLIKIFPHLISGSLRMMIEASATLQHCPPPLDAPPRSKNIFLDWLR